MKHTKACNNQNAFTQMNHFESLCQSRQRRPTI
uniref:Uncharacterized protein n=1 Tax=Anguilla anguilla TaxID=7936 RepID=A0A0E9U6N7_ANGAN